MVHVTAADILCLVCTCVVCSRAVALLSLKNQSQHILSHGVSVLYFGLIIVTNEGSRSYILQMSAIAVKSNKCTTCGISKGGQFLSRDAMQSAVMTLHVVYLSVRLSVTFRYRDHLGWNTSKIISWPNSLRQLLTLMGDLVQREHSQN